MRLATGASINCDFTCSAFGGKKSVLRTVVMREEPWEAQAWRKPRASSRISSR